MTLVEKTESAYKKLKWHEKFCIWDIKNKRFLKTINSFRENLRAEGVEEKDFKSLEEIFKFLKDCDDDCCNKGQFALLSILTGLLTFTDCHWILDFLNKKNFKGIFGILTILVLILNIIVVYSIFLILREISEILRIKNIHYFFLYEDLNARLTEKEKKQGAQNDVR